MRLRANSAVIYKKSKIESIFISEGSFENLPKKDKGHFTHGMEAAKKFCSETNNGTSSILKAFIFSSYNLLFNSSGIESTRPKKFNLNLDLLGPTLGS